MSGLSVYRKIWTNANGPIPVDSDGRTFHIHHVDGNRDNNEFLVNTVTQTHTLVSICVIMVITVRKIKVRVSTTSRKA